MSFFLQNYRTLCGTAAVRFRTVPSDTLAVVDFHKLPGQEYFLA